MGKRFSPAKFEPLRLVPITQDGNLIMSYITNPNDDSAWHEANQELKEHLENCADRVSLSASALSDLEYQIREIAFIQYTLTNTLYTCTQDLKGPNLPMTNVLYGCEKLVVRLSKELEEIADKMNSIVS